VVVLLAQFSTLRLVPDLPISQLYFSRAWNFSEAMNENGELDPNRRYWALFSAGDLYEVDRSTPFGHVLRPGNTSMLAGLNFVNGYSPLMHAGAHHQLGLSWSGFFVPYKIRSLRDRWPQLSVELRFLGVNGIILGRQYQQTFSRVLEKNGWRQMNAAGEGWIFHRTDPVDRVQSLEKLTTPLADTISVRGPVLPGSVVQRFAPVKLDAFEHSRHRDAVSVINPNATQTGLVVFARLWLPGYRARLNDRPLPVRIVDNLVAAVEIPAGAQGRLQLEYAPTSLWTGLAASGTGILFCLGCVVVARRRNGEIHEMRQPA
jgi:hypothetical protein